MENRISLLLLSLVLSSCLVRDESNVNAGCNDGCITFYGRISTNEHSDTPVQSAYIEMGWNQPSISLGNPGRLIAKTYSDKDGYYSMKFKPRDKELTQGQFYIDVFKDGYFEATYDDYGIDKIDTSYNFNLHIASITRLEMLMKNFDPKNEEDYFSVIPTYKSYGTQHDVIRMQGTNGDQSNTFFNSSNGAFTQKEFFGLTAGNQYTYFDIVINKNGERIEYQDSIFVKRQEKGVYEVEY